MTMNHAQTTMFAKMKTRDQKIQMRWDKTKQAPAVLSGDLAEPFAGSEDKFCVAAALDFLDDKKQLFRIGAPKEELSLIQKTTDAKGNFCLAFQQTHKGIPVEGATMRVHFTKEKSVRRVTNKYEPEITLDDVDPQITSKASYEKAIADAGGGTKVDRVPPKLTIYKEKSEAKIAWVVEIIADDTKRPMKYYVDAKDGAILRKFSNLYFMGQGTGNYSGTGALNTLSQNGTFRLIDDTRAATGGPRIHTCDMNNAAYDAATPNNGNVSEDLNDNWNDATTNPRHDNQLSEVDVHRFIAQVVDYYRNTHGWNGIDNTGGDIFSGVHVQFPGIGGPNNAAYWGATDCFYFGDGDNADFDYLSALDITAHEFTHGVTNHTSNLDYFNQAGGLNEAFSDIFAAFVDAVDTQIGEDCTTPAIPGDCLRNLLDPSAVNALSRIPNHVLPALDTMGVGYFDGQDPHDACGPVIYAAALLLVGGTHPNSGITVQPIGYHKCEQIFWHIQSVGLLGNNNATFLECREAAVDAVNALFQGDNDYLPILHSVTAAFSAVGIGPEIFIRDNMSDTGEIPNGTPLYRSPDIIVRQSQEANPLVSFGDLNNDALGENVELGQDNWLYLRLQNRGSVQGEADVTVYWAAPNTFAMPSQWHTIGTVHVPEVNPAELTVAELLWPSNSLPPAGHFCLIAEVNNVVDPSPDKYLISNGAMFSRFVAESNNYAWKNINVVDLLPSGLVNLEFMVSGDDEGVSELQIDLTEIPKTAEVYMRILGRLCQEADILKMSFRDANSRYNYYNMVPGSIGRIRNIAFGNNDTSELHLYVKIPEKDTKTYTITNTQLVNGAVTGRITQVLNVMTEDIFDFIGNANSKELHKKDCQWVSKMNDDNKRGFRSIANAHAAGYDNCATCIGDSKR